MMGILDVLFHNWRQAPRTRQPADHVAYPVGFRGVLSHETDQCVGCTTCRYVCSPGAIQFLEPELDGITWDYRASQCTFCGKCVEYCPTKALRFEQTGPALANIAPSTSHRIEYQSCPHCGQFFTPLPVPTVSRLYGDCTPETITRLMRLCEKCRNRAAVETWKSSLKGELHSEGGGR